MDRLIRALRVRPGEEPMVRLTVGLMFISWAGLTIGQSSVDALLFARYGVDVLPVLYLLLGVLLFVASLAVTALLARTARNKLFPLMPLALAGLLVAGRLWVAAGSDLVYPALWLVAGLALLAQGFYLWGIAGLVTDTRQAKRLFPLLAAGGIAGAAAGGLVTEPLANVLRPENLLLLWACVLIASYWWASAVISRWGPKPGQLTVTARQHRVGALQAVRDGYRTVRRSALLRWMAAGAVLFSVLFYSLYLPFSGAAVERFPDAAELAGFLGAFHGVATGVALLVSVFAANRLFAWFGTPAILLGYTIAYVAGFTVLSVDASFLVLLAVRFVMVVMMQGLANSAWEAMINVAPPERRDEARAFLNGVPAQAGTVLAGVLLLVGQESLESQQLFWIGLGAALLTAFTMWQARRSYVGAVADTLRAGRPHVFDDYEAEPFAGMRTDAAAVSAAVVGLSDGDPRVRRVAAEVLGTLGDPELATPLRSALRDSDATVRVAAVRSLGRLGGQSVPADVADRLTDVDPGVRLAAVQVLRGSGNMPTALPALLDDSDPAVRAEAAVSLLSGEDAARAASLLRQLTDDADPFMRHIAVRALAHAPAGEAARLVAGGLHDAHPSVRASAVAVLAGLDPQQALPPLLGLLADPDSAVRAATADALARIGPTAVPVVVQALEDPTAQSGALLALELLRGEQEAPAVRRFARQSVDWALRDHELARCVEHDGDERRALLHESLVRSAERHALNAIRAVAVLSDRSQLAEAVGSLQAESSAQRAAAVELIDSSSEASTLRPLIAIWEARPGPAAKNPVPDLRRHPDPWIRECAEFVFSAGTEGQPMARTLPTLAVMERVLFLRKVPIFYGLAPEDLKRIAAVAEEHAYSDGDVIIAQGEAGTEMHIIVSGMVAVVVSGREVARLGPGDVVGEMAVITAEPRSATIVAAGDVRLLTIGQRQFEGILRERHETSMAVMRVLARRLAERDARTI